MRWMFASSFALCSSKMLYLLGVCVCACVRGKRRVCIDKVFNSAARSLLLQCVVKVKVDRNMSPIY